MSRKCLVLTSGGIDSTACLAYYLELGFEVEGIFVDYGHSANAIEFEHVQSICSHLEVPISRLEFRGAPLNAAGEIRGRNAFLIVAALMARPTHTGIIALGIHAGSPYYDCSPNFARLMIALVSDHTSGTVQFDTPLLDMTKPAIVQYCQDRDIPLHLTYSCESGAVPPCQTCLSCKDRMVLNIG